MTFGFAPPSHPEVPPGLGRSLEPAGWASSGIPLLRGPREVVVGLHARHRPGPATSVVAVLGPDDRIVASASFARPAAGSDGWECRNVLLSQLRRIVPHDLRRRRPARTAVLLTCRDDSPGWTEEDGAWMWGLRDACTLHGLRCGAYITLTRTGWQVLGEDRSGRRPRLGPTDRSVRGDAAPPVSGAPGRAAVR
ncbi:hypothetical protein [Streptomyces sp. URMC 125]|uniref:hypothetical protein n=1 Tax=Streptomyces sp. URMC 125 TaxID=3423419 RepID=UPI003F1D17A4